MTLSAGLRLGPYEILSPLGAGGMGEVYKARDTRLERTVAVKVLPSHMSASPEVRQRFEREAKTISQLSHPHICALYDVGREGETEYLVMELLEGETLSERLVKGPLPLAQTLRYGVEIADALDKAHRQGIVHRDLKPGNVMLTKSGVKLLDFGLAKTLPSPGGRGVGGEGITSLPLCQRSSGTLGLLRSRPPSAAPIRLSLPAPENTTFGLGSALSPDGRSLVFVGAREGKQLLWLRLLSGFEARPLPGTDGAVNPFWSPDSRFVGFFADSKLKTIEVANGALKSVCDVPAVEPARGGSWSREGVIIFSPDAHSPVYRVSAAGGVPTRVTELGKAQKEGAHVWPEFLPDGHHFLFWVLGGEQDGIAVSSLDSRQKSLLIPGASRAVYAPPGFLLFMREATLMAQPFDAARSRLSGEPLPIAERVDLYFSTGSNGLLAYRAGAIDARQLRWFDRSGRELAKVGKPGDYLEPSLSPDGTRLAIGVGSWTPVGDIWLLELARGGFSRFTPHPNDDVTPIWSPDGKEIAFASNPHGPFDLYKKDAGGAGSDELLVQSSSDKFPGDWSRDGKYLIYYTVDPKTKSDLWVLPMSGERKPTPFLQTEFNEANPTFSPDGRWVAYNSDESGTLEVYVRPFPPSRGKWQVSTAGGGQAVWRSDGKELYYVAPDRRIMAVEVNSGSVFSAGLPVPLFEAPIRPEGITESHSAFVVSSDGQRFLVNTIAEEAAHVPITVVVNWTAELKK